MSTGGALAVIPALRTADDVVASHRQFTERPAEAQISVARYGWRRR